MTTDPRLIYATRYRWDQQHRFCGDDTTFGSIEEARYIRSTHTGHGATCLQALAAAAYSDVGDDE
ncbi:hypothetical protein ACIBCD_26760 [Nocardia brasiliensis]|uniref:hypothetical protein n=1 Tax=Nocardia brasiliensis TaxID=37326 RepID=UPI0037958875